MKPKKVLELALEQGISLTFDDVTLLPRYSEVQPHETNLKTIFTRGSEHFRPLELNIPIVGAAMDTVTEHRMAIALAKIGGLGIIHKNLSPGDQAAEVAKVKREFNCFIETPETVNADWTLEHIINMREEEGWTFHSFPVVNAESRVIGLLGDESFKYGNRNEKAEDIMIKDARIPNQEIKKQTSSTSSNRFRRKIKRIICL